MLTLAAGSTDVATAFVEIGAITIALAVLARISDRIGLSPIPAYLVAGLVFGDGGIVGPELSTDFLDLAGEIGVVLLLLTLGLEYTADELGQGLRTNARVGVVDLVLNAAPGVLMALVLGWGPKAAVVLGGITYISSSGVIAKVLRDLGRLGNRETPSVLSVLVLEDLAMAVYLPVVAALVAGGTVAATVGNVAVSIVVVAAILVVALRYGNRLSAVLVRGNDEALLLGVFGLTLLVAGLAQRVEVSGAIGAFLVGIAVSGPVQARASSLVAPLRDLFAATFFLFFSFQLDPADLVDALAPAAVLAAVTTATKVYTGWYAAGRAGAARKGRLRAGTVLAARGEFSIVIAALGSDLVDGPDLGALAAAYVLLTAIIGPLLTKYADRIAVVSVPSRVRAG
jgi:CPA2 family monovalent cation:H+ antiporter-2